MVDKLNILTGFLRKKGFLLFLIILVSLVFTCQTTIAETKPVKLAQGGTSPSSYLGPESEAYEGNKESSLLGDLAKKAFEASLGSLLRIITTLIATLALSLATLWVSLSAFILEWVMSPDFISLSYTGLDNPIIELGWNVTSNLANMGIVLALIVIGLATILRLESYQAKKTLPTLIIIALLINFAPVLLGVIVDASNILMDFLLSSGSDGVLDFASLGNGFSQVGNSVRDAWSETDANNLTGQLGILGKVAVLVVFSIIAGLIFFLFAALFAFRYIAIWIAVILSPLAFVAYILPKTRTFFDMWWKQFLAWCFIGVIAAFFIYLSVHMLAELDTNSFVQKTGEARINTDIQSQESDWGLLNEILPFGVVIIFLVMGFFMAVSISAMGASSVIDLTKKGGKGAIRGGKGLARQTAGRALTSEWGKKASRWVARRQIPRVKDAKTKAGKVGAFLGKAATPFGYAKRKLGAAALSYGAGIQDRVNEDKEKIKKRFGKDYKSMAAYVSSLSATNYTGKMAGAQALAETKGAKGLNALPETDLRSIIKQTDRYTPNSLDNLIKHKPELIEDDQLGELIQNNLADEDDIIEQMKSGVDKGTAKAKAAFKKAAKALKKPDVENLDDKTLNNEGLQEALAKYASWSIIREIGETKGGKHVANIQKTAQERVGLKEMARTNPSFLKVAYTPGGQAYLNDWKRAGGKGGTITTKEGVDTLIRESSLPPEEEKRREREARARYEKEKVYDRLRGRKLKKEIRKRGSSSSPGKASDLPSGGRKPSDKK